MPETHTTLWMSCVWAVLSWSVVCCSLWPPWTAAHQAPLSMGFSRQEYWRGLPCPPPGDLPNPGIKPLSLKFPAVAGRFFATELPGKPKWTTLKKRAIAKHVESSPFFLAGHLWVCQRPVVVVWRRKWQPTPVFLPGESQGRGSLVGCRLWGRTESDRTEAT